MLIGAAPGTLVLLRHGETEWSRDGRHTGRTDLPLTARGEQQAAAAGPHLTAYDFALVLTSPLQRAARTAAQAGLAAEPDPDLMEWDYGDYEGRRTAEIAADRPGWSIWDEGVPNGETAAEVGERADRALTRVRGLLDEGRDACVVGHAHALRVLTARWLAQPAAYGALWRLDTATVSELGFEHGRPVMHRWNVATGSWED
jgi:probable phosphoglycerate mutase